MRIAYQLVMDWTILSTLRTTNHGWKEQWANHTVWVSESQRQTTKNSPVAKCRRASRRRVRDDGGMVDQICVDHKWFWGMKDIETSYGRRWLKGTRPASIALGKQTYRWCRPYLDTLDFDFDCVVGLFDQFAVYNRFWYLYKQCATFSITSMLLLWRFNYRDIHSLIRRDTLQWQYTMSINLLYILSL